MKYTNALPQLDEKCGEFWRHLILLWKFSCFVEKSNLSSYVIEYNVFETIAETTTLAGEHALLDAVALFFRYPAINRDPLLNKDPGFKKLRHAIDRAANLSRKSKQTESLKFLQSVFPIEIIDRGAGGFSVKFERA